MLLRKYLNLALYPSLFYSFNDIIDVNDISEGIKHREIISFTTSLFTNNRVLTIVYSIYPTDKHG